MDFMSRVVIFVVFSTKLRLYSSHNIVALPSYVLLYESYFPDPSKFKSFAMLANQREVLN